jgi:CheY-like chemotaxis protein
LSCGGALVTTEETGEAALRRCAVAPPAAVIVALVMLGLNGLQVLARLRTDFPTLPVYLLDDDSKGGRMGAKGLAAGAAAIFQSAQAGVWANQVLKHLLTDATVGQAPAWLAGTLPGQSAYLVEECRSEDGLEFYSDRDGLLWVNANHLSIQSLQPSADPVAHPSPGVADDTERMAKRVLRQGHEGGRSLTDLMPALRRLNDGFRTQMTRQIDRSLRQIAIESESQAHALVTAVVIQHIEPVRQQMRMWRGLTLIALVGLCVLGGAVVSQLS